MIIGIGTDIIEIDRIRRAIAQKNFKDNVFSRREQIYCESRMKHTNASYAARFAAKEAFFKALGTGIITRLNNVEILNDDNGAPKIFLHDQAAILIEKFCIGKISLSLSHSHDFATAVCIIEKLE